MGCLYRLDFPNGKSYVGITKESSARRFARHVRNALGGQTTALANAIRKYGAQSVTVTPVIEVEDWELLCLAEQEAIAKWATQSPNGYNLTEGGEGVVGHVHSAETRAKLSAATKAYAAANPEKFRATRVKAAENAAGRTKMLAAWARRLLFKNGAMMVRFAYGECLREKRPCSLIA